MFIRIGRVGSADEARAKSAKTVVRNDGQECPVHYGRLSGGEGHRHVPSKPRRPDRTRERPNPLDAAKITYIDYKDIAMLRTFISDRGKIRSRRVTRISGQQQRQMARAIKNAREMALLPYGTRGEPARGRRPGPA